MTPEGAVKRDIKDYLTNIGAYFFMPVQTGYGKRTLDLLCCINGRFAGIEAKARGRHATLHQRLAIENIETAGGKAFVIDGDLGELKDWVENGT